MVQRAERDLPVTDDLAAHLSHIPPLSDDLGRERDLLAHWRDKGDLARAPWRWAFEARHQTTTDEAVALISEGVISPRPVDDTPAP